MSIGNLGFFLEWGIFMFNSVECVRDLCKQRGIAISVLEKDCGFANGYLNPKKMAKLPYDRAVTIANYLGVSVELILIGEETKTAPAENGKGDILDDVDVAFYGEFKELSEDDKEIVRSMVTAMRQRRGKI